MKQHEMGFLSAVAPLDLLDDQLVSGCANFQQALALSRAMGRRKPTDGQLADAIGVLPCVWSRIQNKPKNRPAYTPECSFSVICESLGNVGILQWLASQVGMSLVPMRETREQKLRRELAEIEAAKEKARDAA